MSSTSIFISFKIEVKCMKRNLIYASNVKNTVAEKIYISYFFIHSARHYIHDRMFEIIL